MSDFEQIQAIVQILSLLAATVLVFLGIRKTVKALTRKIDTRIFPKILSSKALVSSLSACFLSPCSFV